MGIWSRLQAFVIGGAVTRAGSDAVTPVLEPVKQHAWQKNPLRVLEVNTAARLVAQGAIGLDQADEEASRQGFGAERLRWLVQLAQLAPGVAEALTLYRRQQIGLELLHHAYAKAQIDTRYWDGITATAHILLSPAEVANAVQQGHLANDGILPSPGTPASPPAGYVQPVAPDGQPPTDVPLTQLPIDPLTEAAGSGVTADRLKVMANLAGLPPGAEALLTMRNRNVITEEALDSGLREGHLKTKWLEAYKRMRFAVLSPAEAASARLRTWITAAESYEIGALHGYSREQMDLLFLNRGRPASPTQMWRAWARKATGPRGVPVEFEDHAKAIAISDIRPEYAEMLWQIRYNYPSLFQLDRLVQAGTVSADTAAQWAEWNLYAPEVVDALRTAWAGGSKAKADPHVSKAQTQLWTVTHRSYIAEEAPTAAATDRLTLLGVPADAQASILELWNAERSLIRAQLSPADIRKAMDKGVTNPATGAAWTMTDATAALLERGYSHADAQTYLTTPIGGA